MDTCKTCTMNNRSSKITTIKFIILSLLFTSHLLPTQAQSIYNSENHSSITSDDEDFPSYGSGGSGDDVPDGGSGGTDIDYSEIKTIYEDDIEEDQSFPTTEFAPTSTEKANEKVKPVSEPQPPIKTPAPKDPKIIQKTPTEKPIITIENENSLNIEEEINEVEVIEAKSSNSLMDWINDFWGEKYFLAALLAGAIIGFIIISLVILFICYTVRKSDQGSYIIDEQLTQKYAITDYKYTAGMAGGGGGGATIVKESSPEYFA